MANVHMKTAARNLERAVSDYQQKSQEIRYQSEQAKKEKEQEISDLRTEENRIRAEGLTNDDNTRKMTQAARMTQIKDRISELEKEIFEVEDQARREIAQLDQQANRVRSYSSQLSSLA